MSTVVAVDGGQSQVRAAVHVDCVERGACTLPGLHYGDDGDGVRTVTNLLDLLERHLPRPQLPPTIDTFVLALSGMPSAAAPQARIAHEVTRRFRPNRQLIASDMPAAYAGALGVTPGAVLSAGSGTIALALDGHGTACISGGGGPLLGDDGSGYRIGLVALREAWRVHTGRPGSAELHRMATQRYGPMDALPKSLRRSQNQVGEIAAFVPDVAAAAAGADIVAAGILRDAGKHLADILSAAATAVFGTSTQSGAPVLASWNGRLLQLPALRSAFADHLRRMLPAVQLVAPAGTALDGALRLAYMADLAMFGRHITIVEAPAASWR
jgi:glucosamine kinase